MVPEPVSEFSYWEFDIKYVWIHGKRRNAQVLTILDVFVFNLIKNSDIPLPAIKHFHKFNLDSILKVNPHYAVYLLIFC
jgi:hypothetical protein